MTKIIFPALISMLFLFQNCICAQPVKDPELTRTSKYKNELYRFSAVIPETWKLYGEIKNDTIDHHAIVGWELPSVYSEREQKDIQNSVSVTAYRIPAVKSVKDLMVLEEMRMGNTIIRMEADPANNSARIIYYSANGLHYKGKSYYVYRKKIGYVITFMATEGTYDKNLPVFEAFNKKLKFY